MEGKGKVWRLISNHPVFALAGTGLLALCLITFMHQREPTYRGRTASSWLRQAAMSIGTDKEARDALRSMGTKAVPVYLETLGRNNSAFDTWYEKTFPKLPRLVQKFLRQPVSPMLARHAAYQALCSCQDSRDYLDEIMALLQHRDPIVRHLVSNVIAMHLRPGDTNCVPLLIAALNDDNVSVRRTMAEILARFGSAAADAGPMLRKTLTDESLHVRITSAYALSLIDSNSVGSNSFVLRQAMFDSDLSARVLAAIRYLEVADSSSQEGVVVLVASLATNGGSLKSRNSVVRFTTESALRAAENCLMSLAVRSTNIVVELNRIVAEGPSDEMRLAAKEIVIRVAEKSAGSNTNATNTPVK